jgi:hypothetical protein
MFHGLQAVSCSNPHTLLKRCSISQHWQERPIEADAFFLPFVAAHKPKTTAQI